MFEYEKDTKGNYWIYSEKMIGKYGPFQGVYVKNQIFGDFPALFETSVYPGYKYSLGSSGTAVFIIATTGLVAIKKLDIFEK